jgi:hypothetical protein
VLAVAAARGPGDLLVSPCNYRFSADAAWASRWKRLKACGSLAMASGRNFQRHIALQANIFRFEDHTHAAAQLLKNAVVGIV